MLCLRCHSKACASCPRLQTSGASKTLVIAKMDGTANEVDFAGFAVQGFPTIFFFPATKDGAAKEAVEYKGGRDFSAFVAFLNKEATHAPKLPDAPAEAEEAEDDDFDGEYDEDFAHDGHDHGDHEGHGHEDEF